MSEPTPQEQQNAVAPAPPEEEHPITLTAPSDEEVPPSERRKYNPRDYVMFPRADEKPPCKCRMPGQICSTYLCKGSVTDDFKEYCLSCVSLSLVNPPP